MATAAVRRGCVPNPLSISPGLPVRVGTAEQPALVGAGKVGPLAVDQEARPGVELADSAIGELQQPRLRMPGHLGVGKLLVGRIITTCQGATARGQATLEPAGIAEARIVISLTLMHRNASGRVVAFEFVQQFPATLAITL